MSPAQAMDSCMNGWRLRIRAAPNGLCAASRRSRYDFCLANFLGDRPEHLDARVDLGGREHLPRIVEHGDAPMRDGPVEADKGEPMNTDTGRYRDLALGNVALLVDEQEVRVVRDLRRGIETAVEIAVPVDHVFLPVAVRCPPAPL